MFPPDTYFWKDTQETGRVSLKERNLKTESGLVVKGTYFGIEMQDQRVVF